MSVEVDTLELEVFEVSPQPLSRTRRTEVSRTGLAIIFSVGEKITRERTSTTRDCRGGRRRDTF